MKKLLLALFAFISVYANATVWVRNGNLFLRFYDINEGNNFELVRYYNSVGYEQSVFGYGWGTTLGPKLVLIDGLIVIEELSG